MQLLFILQYCLMFIKNVLNKKELIKDVETVKSTPRREAKKYDRDELLSLLDLNKIDNLEVKKSDKPLLLIVDDIPDTLFILKSTSNDLRRKYNIDFTSDYNIVFSTYDTCGLTSYKFILREDINIEYALIDLSIGTRINVSNADILELDGIDIAELLLQKFPNAKIKLFTAHTLSRDDKRMKKYYSKCYEKLKVDLEDITISKSEERSEQIRNFLY